MPAPRGVSRRILIASADQVLSNSRKLVLQNDGWEVTVTRNKQHGLALLHSTRFVLMLVCDSLAERTLKEYVSLYRAYNASGKVLLVERSRGTTTGADAFLPSPVEPGQLLRTVRQLVLGETTGQPEGSNDDR